MSYQSLLLLLASALSLPSIQAIHQIITNFHCTYILPFLSKHPHPQTLLDPDYAQIKLRLSLRSQHPSLDWTSSTEGADQTAQATRFVYMLIESLSKTGNRDLTEMLRDESALREAHQILCRLQSIWIGNGEWEVGDREAEVREALGTVLKELEGR